MAPLPTLQVMAEAVTALVILSGLELNSTAPLVQPVRPDSPRLEPLTRRGLVILPKGELELARRYTLTLPLYSAPVQPEPALVPSTASMSWTKVLVPEAVE